MNPVFKFFENLYTFLWRDFLCRLEPFTYEFRRHVTRWWWLDIVFFGIGTGVFLWMLLFPLAGISQSWRITIIVLGACGMVFFAWLLLHLGNFASRIFHRLANLLASRY
jgi:hypothetical protein